MKESLVALVKNNMQNQIKNLIKDALKKLDIEEVDFIVEHPEDFKNGDYSTNVAMVYFGPISKHNINNIFEKGGHVTIGRSTNETSKFKSPKMFAETLKVELEKNLTKEIEKVEVAGAGFINFYLSQEFFTNSINEILEKGEKFGQNNSLSGQKVIIEHTDPNPFKEFHIGHLMPNVIGSTVSRIFEWNGGEVKQACYQGDVGMHVAKAVWAMKNGSDIKEAYVVGTKAYEENENFKKEIQEINKKIYDRSDVNINKIYDLGRAESLEYFDSIYTMLGTNFDYLFFESEVASIGKEIVEENTGKTGPEQSRRIFEKGDEGAIIFRAENFDEHLHTRVFVNSEGLPTYEAKELGLAKVKYEKYQYDKSVIITGNEINDYFKVLLCAIKQIFPELAEKTTHLSHGMLRLPTGKMSSRTGDVITAENLIEIVKEKTKGDEGVAIAAIKYMILRQSIGGDIIFDIEKSVSTEGDSGPYLQYSNVRANSVLEKAKIENLVPNTNSPEDWGVIELEKLLYRFPEVVLYSMQELEPHHIVNYLTELARAFNSFYGNTKIIDKDDASSPYKLALTSAFATVMQNGLYLLGIKVPEKM